MSGQRALRSRGYRSSVIALVAMALVVPLMGTAVAAPAQVTEFSVASRWIDGIAQSPNGTLRFSGTVGTREHWAGRIGSIDQDGQVEEIPVSEGFPGQLTVDSEGNAWFLGSGDAIGRLNPSGTYSETAIASGNDFAGNVAPARNGGIWFSKGRGSFATDTVGRVTPDGKVKEYPLPSTESRPEEIIEAADGSAWFTEFFGDKIGQITPSGNLVEFPLPPGSRPFGIAEGAEGNIYFTEEGGSFRVGRVNSAGLIEQFQLPADVYPGRMTTGGDGRLWFTTGQQGVLGRLTPSGRFTKVPLPDRESDPVDVVSGSEGLLWYTAMGEGPCEGGGGTCMLWVPKNPAIVGRMAPSPLTTTVAAKRATTKGNRARVPLACVGGKAEDVCRGRVEMRLRGKVLAAGHYELEADETLPIAMRWRRGARSGLTDLSRPQVRVVVTATSGRSSARTIVLRLRRQ